MLDTLAVQELRIGISPHSGALILAETCAPFSHHFPAVRLVPHEGYANDLKELLREGAIDLCVTSGEEVEGLERFPVSREEIVLAVPAAQAAAFRQGADEPKARLADPVDFHSAVFVLPDRHSSLHDYIAPLLAGFQPQVAFTTPNMTMLRKMISSGAGVGFLPRHHALADPKLHIFHLRPPRHMTYAIFTWEGHSLGEMEQYLFFLWLNNSIGKGIDMVWNEFNRKLMWQYAPGEAAALQMEKPQ